MSLEVARLLESNGDFGSGLKYYARAADLFRKRVEAQAGSATDLAGLAEAQPPLYRGPHGIGHFLRQELVRSVGQGVPGFSAGTLDVALRQRIDRLAFAPDQAASRSDYIGIATWTLRGATGDILGTGTVQERASFNFADAAYADLAAQTAAQERLATLLARAVRAEMIMAGGKTVDPKTGLPPVQAAKPATPQPAPPSPAQPQPAQQ